MAETTMNPVVYSTGPDTDAERRRRLAPIHAVANARPAPFVERRATVNGHCTRCGSVEVRLVNGVTGHRDLSSMGESSAYPFGPGCELCS